MPITFDPAKRDWTLVARRLDFADAEQVIEGGIFEYLGSRREYGEERITTIGFLDVKNGGGDLDRTSR